MEKEDIIRKLTSRKFWAAIVGFVTGLLVYLGKSTGEAEQIGALIMMGASVVAYIFGEGWADNGRAIKMVDVSNLYEPPDEDAE